MSNADPSVTPRPVRIGFVSRIDYGSDGFRQWLLDKTAETFKRHNASFVVLLGGLVSGRAVDAKTTKIKKDLRVAERTLKKLLHDLAGLESEDETSSEKKPAAKTKRRRAAPASKPASELKAQATAQERVIEGLKTALEALTPEKMAEDLAQRLPHFVNADGKQVKLYIVPSTPYDKAVGIATAGLLAEKRGNREIRVMITDGDRLPLIWEEVGVKKVLEVLTLDKQPWLRGENDSTAAQRRISDKSRQTSQRTPVDIQVVGGIGVSILKPEGQCPVGFMAVPVCHKIGETTTAERQVGVQIMEVDHNRRNVTMHSYSFRDDISRERTFVNVPETFPQVCRDCISLIQAEGKQTTGALADLTGLSRENVVKTLAKVMAGPKNKLQETWPGLTYDKPSDRWDFDLEWVKMSLRYRPLTGTPKIDKMVCICCMHAGSLDSDYKHFLEGVPRVMLRHGVTTLVSAGDHVEGTAHDMLAKGEVYLGLDNTQQEVLAANMIAHVLYQVFQARYDAAIQTTKKFSAAENRSRVDETLPRFVYVPGNHCGWISHAGVKPLVTMVHEIVRILTQRVDAHLATHGHSVGSLLKLVESHIETSRDGRFLMPSGLKMGMTHPHMGGSKTVSSSAQQALAMYRDCQVVVIGNFHTACVVEGWDPQLGQRPCIQVGTMKHHSPFEASKMKPGLDQGFAYTKIISVDGHIVSTETTFDSHDTATAEEKHLDRNKPFLDFLSLLGILPV